MSTAGVAVTALLIFILVISALSGVVNIVSGDEPTLSDEASLARYLTGQGYSLEANGTLTQESTGQNIQARLSMNFTIDSADARLVIMKVTAGIIDVGNNELTFSSGRAYYLVHFHQFRIAIENIDSDATKNLRISAVTVGREDLPTGRSDPMIQIRIIGPPSRLGPESFVAMVGTVTPLDMPPPEKQHITLTALLNDNGDPERFHKLLAGALEKLKERHPELDISLSENQYPYPDARTELVAAVGNNTSADIVSIDQIWLGELAEKGMLADLTEYAKEWGRSSDWYSSNWDGGAYKGKTYAIWLWTDVRGMYYWKDMLAEAGVDPSSLKTWDGYLAAARTLNEKLGPEGIEGIHLTGVGHSPDLWYPYLWMLGGDIVEQKSGHPSKGVYWFPAYNSSQGVEALTFLKKQVEAGIKPQTEHYWGKEFHDRKFAVMIEASHVPGYFQSDSKETVDKVGFIPMFPVPNATVQTTTLMGGWEMGIPATSQHKELSWELITLIADPEILSPWLAEYNYLPTQLPIGEGPHSELLAQSNPFFDDMASEIQYGRSRPSIPEYPAIAEHIREAINDVYYGVKDPKQALDDAAAKSAQALGWAG